MPRINFTARSIEALRASYKREEYWDDSFPGFGLRVSIDGRKSWTYFYRVNGRLRRLTIGSFPALSLADARQRALEAQYAITKGLDPALEKQVHRNAETFQELVEIYIERHAKVKKKSWKEDNRILNREFMPSLRHWKAVDVKRRDVLAILDKIMERNSPILANKALAIVRKVFNFAIQRDILQLNPCWGISAPGKTKRRDRVLNKDELQAVWGASEGEDLQTRSFYRLLILTAQRSGELSNATWPDIDLMAGWWAIPAEKTKNGLLHRVPLSKAALKLFKELRLHSGGSQWVFPSPKISGPIQERKRKLLRIKILSKTEFCPHDLRRTAASFMTSSGISRLTVSKILNHAETSVTAIYDRHSYDREKRDALEQWSDTLQILVSAQPNADNFESRL